MLTSKLKEMLKRILIIVAILFLQDWTIVGGLISYAGGTVKDSLVYDDSGDYTPLNTAAGRNAVVAAAGANASKLTFIQYDTSRITQNEKLPPDYYYTVNNGCLAEWFGVLEDPRSYLPKATEVGADMGFRLSQNTPGQVGIIWRRALRYKGQDVDVKYTFTDWEYFNDKKDYMPAMVYGFNRAHPGTWSATTQRIRYLKYDVEFFKSDTGERSDIKGVFSYNDVDGRQALGINLNDVQKVYIQIDPSGSEAQSTHLDAHVHGNWLDLASKTTEEHLSSATEGCAVKYHQYSFLYDGSQSTKISTIYRSVSLPANGPDVGGFVIHLSMQQLIPLQINRVIGKTVTDANEIGALGCTLQTVGEQFTFNINYDIPRETETYGFYRSLYFQDIIDSRLVIDSVVVYDQYVGNVTDWFSISTAGNNVIASVRGDLIANPLIYGRTYSVQITVHYNGAPIIDVPWLQFRNQAHVVIDEGGGPNDIPSNEVVVTLPVGYVQVIKKDRETSEPMAGVQFGIYTDIGCTNWVQTITTGADGRAKSTGLSLGTYYVKELTIPPYYVQNTDVQVVRTFNGGDVADANVTDKPYTVQIVTKKIDEQTRKVVTKEETTFAVYEWSTSSNTYIAPTHIKSETFNGTTDDGAAILKQQSPGTKGTYSGTVYYNPKNAGKFKIVEYSRPYGYTTSGWSREIQITSDGQVFSYNDEIRNNEVKAQIDFKKNDKEVNYKNEDYNEEFAQGDATLEGAVYGLYAKDPILSPDDGAQLYAAGAEIARGTTDKFGKITWDDLYLGKYYVKEIKPSKGYLIDPEEHEVDVNAYYNTNYYLTGDQRTQHIVYKNTVEDTLYANGEKRALSKEQVMKQAFQLVKLGLADDSTMADPLKDAGFKIYLIKDLSKVKDGTIKPDARGKFKEEDFLDYDFTEELTALDFKNDPNGQRIQELYSGEEGVLKSPELAYGQYIVIESTVPENYVKIHPFIVDIEEDSREAKSMVYPIDREFTARIRIIKKDNDTEKTVLKGNVQYRIWNLDTNEYVEQWAVNNSEIVQFGTEDNPYTTTDKGELITPNPLEQGNYEIREVKAPEGYVIAGKEEPEAQENVKFSVSTNNVYEMDTRLGINAAIITVEQGNDPQVGKLTVKKEGEFLSDAQKGDDKYEFKYTKRAVTDAKFAIFAKEDILTQDNQVDENGERTKIYVKDELIREVETNEQGEAIFEELPLGKYYVKEVTAGNGFVLNEEVKEFEFTYAGQEIAIIYQNTEYVNERQKVEVRVTKKDREEGTVLEGAVFGLCTKEDIEYTDDEGEKHTISADELVAQATTGEDGVAVFNDENLPLAKYYIKELKAPKGYSSNKEKIDVECTYIGQEHDKVVRELDFTNRIITLKIKIQDYETKEDLVDTKIQLKDEDGNIIGEYTLDENGEIVVKGLEVGKRYKIEETQERYGYVRDLLFDNEMQDEKELQKGKDVEGLVTFTIKDSEEDQTVHVSNISKVGSIEIEKIGDVLVDTKQDERGNIEFVYEKQRIDTAEFEIIAKEDIIHPDGVQGIIVKAGTKIGRGKTKKGLLTITKFDEDLIQTKPEVVQLLLKRGLPLGAYTIKEIKAPSGYYYRKEEQEVTVRIESHVNKEQVEKQTVTIENPRQSTNIGKPNSSISITKKADKEVYNEGEEAVYTIVVSNTGDTILTDIEVTETMINGSFDQIDGIIKKDNNKVVIERLEVGESKLLTYRYVMPKGIKGKIENKVIAVGTPVRSVVTEDGKEVEEKLDKVTDDAKENVYLETVIEKTSDKKMYKPGDIIEYTLEVLNPNDTAIENAKITDEKVTVGSIIRTSKEGVRVEQNGTIIIGEILPRERINIVYKYQIPEDYDEETIENKAKITGTIEGKEMTPEEDEVIVEVKKSGIEVTKESDKERYEKGDIVTYTIKVTNTGETLLTDVVVKEKLLNGKFQEKSGIEIIDDQTVRIEKLKVGQTITLTYKYEITEDRMLGEKIDNNVEATGTGIIENPDDPEHPKKEEVSDEAEKEVVVQEEKVLTKPNTSISVEKKAEKEVYKIGEKIKYTITVVNTGDATLKDIEVKETMLNGNFEEAEGVEIRDNNTAIIERLEVGETKELTYYYTATEENKGKLDNKVIAIGTPVISTLTPDGEEQEEEFDKVTDDAEEEVYVETVIEKTANKRMYKPGDTIEYTLVVTNPNDVKMENAEIKDEKVKVGSIKETSKEGVKVTQDGVILIGEIEAREKIEIVYSYEIPKDYDKETIENEAQLEATLNGEPMTPEKDEETVEVNKSGIEIKKETEKEQYRKGEVVNYKITVTNTGETLLTDVIVKEKLLDGRFEEKEGIQIIDDQTVKIARLEVGKSITLNYRYTVPVNKLIGEKIYNDVEATGTGIIENPDDPSNPKKEEVRDETDKNIVVKDNDPITPELGVYKTDVETGEIIHGAIFGLYAEEDILGLNGNVLIAKDTLIEKAITDKDGYAKFKADLPIGKFYIVEISPIEGYIHNTKKLEVDSTEILSTEKEYRVKLDIQNKKTEINIEKIEKTDNLEKRLQIVGATLQILDADKNVVKEWVTDGKAQNIKGLLTEKEYTLHEKEPGRGYVTTDDIKFTINIDGTLRIDKKYELTGESIPTIIMQDDITRVKVDIVDKKTKEPVKDVVVQIVDKKTGEVVEEFVTDGKEHIIEKLPIGDYDIVEKDFPRDKGYVPWIEAQSLTVKDTPELQEKVIEQDYTKLDVKLLDEATKDILPGGKLELRNSKGEVVATIDDTGITWYKERLPAGEYTLVEVVVPEGYEKADDIKFTLKDIGEVQHVVIENKRLPFDMKAEKYASEVKVNGVKQTGTDYNGREKIVKVDLNGKKISSQKVEVTYIIRITNAGKVTGSVGKVVDSIPSGLTFNASKNEAYWKQEGSGTVVTTVLENKQLKPGEYVELKIVLDWNQNNFNFGNKMNVVSIGGLKNNPGFGDENQENNTGTSSVLFSIKTGLEEVLTNQTVAIVLLALSIIGILATIEIILIKKKNRK